MDCPPKPERSMPTRPKLKLHRSPVEESYDLEPGSLSMEPDDGLVLPMIPEDPEHDRVIDPED